MRLRGLQRWSYALVHTTFQILIDYLEEQLSPDQAVEVTTHLAHCVQCARDLTVARYFLMSMRGSDLQTPQAGLLRRAVAAFRHHQQRLAQRLQQVGDLGYDNWQDRALVGARGLATEHQLLYQVADCDVDLQITHDVTTQTYVLRGQILTTVQPQATIEGSAIHLTDDAMTIERSTLADHLGRFQFSYLPKGSYTLAITFEATDVVINTIHVSNEPR